MLPWRSRHRAAQGADGPLDKGRNLAKRRLGVRLLRSAKKRGLSCEEVGFSFRVRLAGACRRDARLVVALTGTAVATTSALITGKQIKNSSITGADVKNKSLTPKDFRGRYAVLVVRPARRVPRASGPFRAAGARRAAGCPGTYWFPWARCA